MSRLRSVNSSLKKLWKNIGEEGYKLKQKANKKALELISRYGHRPRGIVQLDVIDVATGVRVGGFKDDNVIVDLARSNMSRLIVGDATASRILGSIKFSDGGHNPSNNEPLVPTVGDTALGGATIIEKTLTSGDVVVSHPDDYSTRFQVAIEANEGNGSGFQTYSELGLFTVGDVMFSRKTFGAQTKSDALRLVVTYTVVF